MMVRLTSRFCQRSQHVLCTVLNNTHDRFVTISWHPQLTAEAHLLQQFYCLYSLPKGNYLVHSIRALLDSLFNTVSIPYSVSC